MNNTDMTTKQTASQLRLAADIIETGHPFEMGLSGVNSWQKAELENPAVIVTSGREICLTLATPPDNRPLHNPDNLTAEQVGAGWRLAVEGEGPHPQAQMWHEFEEQWTARIIPHQCLYDGGVTYRVPLSTPWPEAEKLDPYAEPETKTVELGPEDVPPGSVFRGAGEIGSKGWCLITSCSDAGIRYWRHSDSPGCGKEYPWSELRSNGSQINRSIPRTGKWNPNSWEPCHKPAPVDEIEF